MKWTLTLSAMLLGSAEAAVFVVDRIDDDPSFMSCTDDPIDCSLRGAVLLAEVSPGADEIVIPADTFSLTETGATGGQIQITTDIVIRGAGLGETILEPAVAFGNLRAFRVESGGALTLEDMEFVGFGQVSDALSALVGGVIAVDDDADSQLTVRRVRFANNRAALGSAINIGSAGEPGDTVRLRITDSVFEFNDVNTVATALCSGAIRIFGALAVIERTEIRDNDAGSNHGGGLCLINGELIAQEVTLLRNRAGATRFGSGFYNFGGIATFTDSSIDNNDSPGTLGAIHSNGGQLTIEDSLIIGNSTASGALTFSNNAEANLTRTRFIANGDFQLSADDAVITVDDVEMFGMQGGLRLTSATLEGTELLVDGHQAADGAGLNASLSIVSLRNCEFRDNQASDSMMLSGLGGAMRLVDTSFGASGCTWHNNSAVAGGGAISITGTTSARINNSTFSDNTAGSAESLQLINSSGVVLTHVTMAENNSDSQIEAINSNLTLTNNAIEGFCSFGVGGGTATTMGGNVVTNAACFLAGVEDLQVADLNLSPLGNFGGATPTHLPNMNSAVVAASTGNCSTSDQRGEPRGIPCSAGAVERLANDNNLFSDGFESI